jgi:DNA-binding PadR family transcriptional regulator
MPHLRAARPARATTGCVAARIPSPPVSPTRLLVLGVVRIFQPVHGYWVRRELLSWGVQDWGHVNPGSIYHALRAMARDGAIEAVTTTAAGAEAGDDEAARAGTEADGGRPARTSYRLTLDGEQEFFALLRTSLWMLDDDPSAVLAGLCFMVTLPRDEVVEALNARAGLLEARIQVARRNIGHAVDARLAPPHSAEVVAVQVARWQAEQAWATDLAGRLRAGALRFRPEPGWDDPPGPDGWPLTPP